MTEPKIELRFRREEITRGTVRYEEFPVRGILNRTEGLHIRKSALKTAFKGWPEELHVSIGTSIQK